MISLATRTGFETTRAGSDHMLWGFLTTSFIKREGFDAVRVRSS
jgi:hypothetical protein